MVETIFSFFTVLPMALMYLIYKVATSQEKISAMCRWC